MRRIMHAYCTICRTRFSNILIRVIWYISWILFYFLMIITKREWVKGDCQNWFKRRMSVFKLVTADQGELTTTKLSINEVMSILIKEHCTCWCGETCVLGSLLRLWSLPTRWEQRIWWLATFSHDLSYLLILMFK